MKYIEIKAPAKINIGLSILSKRSDGFHDLSTLFYPISDLFDLLIFESADKFSFECNTNSVPSDHSNLVVKAKNILEMVTEKRINVKITLNKQIPSQAGLGGGSSDAAATLISLNEMFRLGLTYEQLINLSLKLGSDVPFFIRSRPAIGTSRGEVLEYIDLEITDPILIINPRINISTKEAFQNIIPGYNSLDYRMIIKEDKLDYSMVKELVKNDFEDYVFNKYPEIGRIKESLYSFGAYFALMSGSGSTVYGIFPDNEMAEIAMSVFSRNYFCYLSIPHH